MVSDFRTLFKVICFNYLNNVQKSEFFFRQDYECFFEICTNKFQIFLSFFSLLLSLFRFFIVD